MRGPDEAMGGGLPDFVVIGAMKCGTSTLHDQLALRSGIHMSTPKEPNFFSDDDRFAEGLDAYRRCFAGAAPGQRLGESSTHYSKLPTHPRAVERLAPVLPEARFVYVVRHPIERIVSQYVHEWSQREVEPVGIEAAAERHERFVAYSQYDRQLAPWLAHFGHERILLVAFERMLAEPDAELARICAFLGDPSPEPPRWQERPAHNVSAERLRRSPLREGLLRRPAVRGLVDRLPAGLREALKRPWRLAERPELSAAARQRLAERIDPDLARLGERLGRPLSCASWHEQARGAPFDWKPAGGS